MITYNKISERTEKWGIDVTVSFNNNGVYHTTKTFRFDNQKQLDTDFSVRMIKALSNIQDSIDETLEPTIDEKLEAIEKYFETNTDMSKEDFIELKDTGSVSISEVTK